MWPAFVVGNKAVPSSRPVGLRAAAACTSLWVSTPPITSWSSGGITAMSSSSPIRLRSLTPDACGQDSDGRCRTRAPIRPRHPAGACVMPPRGQADRSMPGHTRVGKTRGQACAGRHPNYCHCQNHTWTSALATSRNATSRTSSAASSEVWKPSVIRSNSSRHLNHQEHAFTADK